MDPNDLANALTALPPGLLYHVLAEDATREERRAAESLLRRCYARRQVEQRGDPLHIIAGWVQEIEADALRSEAAEHGRELTPAELRELDREHDW